MSEALPTMVGNLQYVVRCISHPDSHTHTHTPISPLLSHPIKSPLSLSLTVSSHSCPTYPFVSLTLSLTFSLLTLPRSLVFPSSLTPFFSLSLLLFPLTLLFFLQYNLTKSLGADLSFFFVLTLEQSGY